MSSAREVSAALTLGAIAIFAGGWPASAVVDMYNSNYNNWTVATLSLARNELTTATLGTLAVFIGGYDGTSNSLLVKATTSTILNADSSYSTTLGSLGFVVGNNGVNLFIDMFVVFYNLTSDSWYSQTNILPGVWDLAGITAGRYGLFAGGSYTNTQVTVYSFETNAWTVYATGFSIGRSYSSCICYC